MAGYASLDWYELPETREVIDRLWRGLAGHLAAAGVAPIPERLTRPDDPHEPVDRDDLTIGQICGFVVGGIGRDKLAPVATLGYLGTECEGTRYRSLIAVRRSGGVERFEDLAGARAVINDPLSHSGCNALRQRVAAVGSREPFFAAVGTSGSHAASVDWLTDGRADVAAIDCITWALLARYRPSALEGLVVIERSPLAPSPPLVTAAKNAGEIDRYRAALASFFDDPETQPDRQAVLWDRFDLIDTQLYRALVADKPDVAGF